MRFAALFIVASLAITGLGCSKKVDEPIGVDFTPTKPAPPPAEPADMLKVDTVVGTGPEAKSGDTVKVNYTGTLAKDGSQFDSSVGREPFEFTIGKGRVIKGWDEGIPGMKVGGKRTLTIPSKLGYGETGSGDKIPPNSTLKFDIELLGIDGVDAGAPAKDAGAKK